MGRFIVSRTATGECFLLQSDVGRVLCVSREYATLDACKKGIASLVRFAPKAPIVDSTAGECGANPKFEITRTVGGFVFELKSANGKSVIVSGTYATKKACLRAIAMLRGGVANAEVFFSRPAGLQLLKMQEQRAVAVSTQAKKPTPRAAEPVVRKEAEQLILEETRVPIQAAAPAVTVSHSTPTPAVTPKAEAPRSSTVVPRLIRLTPTGSSVSKPQGTKSTPLRDAQKKRSVLDIFFKK